MVPAGKYKARGVNAELGFAETGTEQVCVTLSITGEEFPGETLHWYGFFTEATARKTLEQLKTLGFKGDWSTFDGISDNEVSVVLVDEPDKNGVLRTRVKWINSLGGSGIKNAMDEQQRRTFAAKMNGLVREVLSTGAQPVVRPAAKPAQVKPAPRNITRPAQSNGYDQVSEDDLPFLGAPHVPAPARNPAHCPPGHDRRPRGVTRSAYEENRHGATWSPCQPP